MHATVNVLIRTHEMEENERCLTVA